MGRCTASLLLFLLFILAGLSPLQARSLSWQDMSVQARLDSRGVLHVRETQVMVFTGPWNGGERRFNLRPGQHLVLQGIHRLDQTTGQEIPLIHGSLGKVDHWAWSGSHQVRWRSRLPSDPPFNGTVISYVLTYTLDNILLSSRGGFLLDQDFCFPDRNGVIRHFSLDLRFDPAWQINGPSELHVEKRDIPPGQGVVVTRQLHYAGSSAGTVHVYHAPATASPQEISLNTLFPANRSAPAWFRFLLLGSLWLMTALGGFFLYRYEKKQGRYIPLRSPADIDRSWLEQHLFQLRPEVVGASWDKTTNACEVAAVLARLVQEGKIDSRVEKKPLQVFGFSIGLLPGRDIVYMTLSVPREKFNGYERGLVDELFFNGDETDSEAIRTYYQKKMTKVFNPLDRIREPVEKQVRDLTEGDQLHHPLQWRWVPTALLGVAGFFLLFANTFIHQDEFGYEVALFGVLFFLFATCQFAVSQYRNAVDWLGLRFTVLLSVLLILVLFVTWIFFRAAGGSVLLLLSLWLFSLAMVNNVLNRARTRDTKEGVALQRRLGAVRRFFRKELKKEHPDLEDTWFPYLVAFGLAPKVDSWLKRYGGSGYYGMNSGGTVVSSGFTGGGGQFGGAGATGSWSAAIGSITGSVSGGSGGGVGGGGSSGGGGGGGW